jgi:eukaryotic-like serine/threonine-protein kinase
VSEIAPIFDLVKDQWSGRKLGRFEVICKLGMGGMSEVFLAWQRGVGGFRRAVVIKRIHDMVKGQDDFVRMFVQEAKITSSLTHSAIAQLHDLSEENGELFMVMEFVPGATLVEIARACLNAQESIPVGLTLAVIRETAMALHYAHTFKDAVGRSRPVIHRDIAEKNIMVSLDGKTKLLDFGIARQQGRTSHTQVGTVKGTAGYMSPEQVKGEKLDGRTDIFSLGIVLHECLTGQRLFKAATRSDEIQALLHGTIPPPSARNRAISPALDAIVMKALSRDRTQRYSTAQELAQTFDRLAGVEVWSEAQRADFMGRHFDKRRKQIAEFIGDPSRSESGEISSEMHSEEVNLGDEDPSTMIALRPRAPIAVTATPSSPGMRETMEEAGPGSTRDDRAARPGMTSPGGRSMEDASATLPPGDEETHSEVSVKRAFGTMAPEELTGPSRVPEDKDDETKATNPAGLNRKKQKGVNPQVLAMVGIGATLMLAILLVLFW